MSQVLLSYFLALFLAIVYGPYLFVAAHILPSFSRFSEPSRFVRWLLYHQKTALWSQLLFTLAIVVACVVRRHDGTLQAYEGAVIQLVVCITATSTIMTWGSFLQRVERWGLFVALALMTAVLSFYAVASPAKTQLLHWNTINACINKYGLTSWSDRRLPSLISFAILICILLIAWLYLQKLSNWGESEKPPVRSTPQQLQYSQIA